MDAIVDQAFQAQRGRYYFLFDCAEYGDKLKVLKFSVDERVSKPYKVKVELATRDKVDPRQLNDRFARLTIVDKHHPQKRYYCGIVAKAVQKDKGFRDGFTRFSVTLRPELFFARHSHDNEIFQNLTIPEIVDRMLAKIGVTRYRWELFEEHERRVYVVQYKRSDLQFIQRLLASEGIGYAFVHHEDGVELVLFDKSIEMAISAGAEELEYNATAGAEVRGQIIKSFAWAESVRTNVATFREQHFKNPALMYQHKWGSDAGNGQQRILEKYTFPGYYKADTTGEQAARYEADSLLADASEGSGMGHAQFLAAGHRFQMQGHDDKRYNATYFLVNVRQSGRQTNVEEEFATEGDGTFLETKFTCVRQTTPWRPARPEVQQTDGTHLATVVGPEGEEIYCDGYGRVKIFFHWDRRGKKNDSASCWVRVSQNWAGTQYGGMMIPRIGQSVIVSYINGDIEQPIISGRLYNSVEQVPYKLPDHKTKSVWRSDTHKGRGFNEVSFEDQAGQEKIYIHGQKDQDIHIENNRSKRIDNNQSESVGHNKSIEVGNNHHEVIGGNMTLMVGPNKLQQFVTGKFKAFTDKVGGLANKLGIPDILNMGEGNLIIGVGKNKAETVMVSSTEIVGAAKALTVGGGYQVTVGGVKNESVGVGSWEEVGQTKVTVVGHKYEIVCGDSKIVLERDGTITMEAKKQFVVKSGKIKLN